MAFIAFAHSEKSIFHGADDVTDETADTTKFDTTYTDRAIKFSGNDFGAGGSLTWEDGHNEVWIHFDYWASGGGATTDGTPFWVFGDADKIWEPQLTNDTWQSGVWNNSNSLSTTGTGVGNSLQAILHSLNTYDIRIAFNEASSGNIVVDWYENGTLKWQQSVAIGTNRSTEIKGIAFEGLYNENQWVSQLMVADEDTRGLKLCYMEPNAAGNYAQWDGDDEDTDVTLRKGISTDTNGNRHSWNLQAWPGPASPTSFRVFNQLQGNTGDTGPSQLDSFLRIASTDYDSGAVTHVANEKLVYEWATNPNTAAAWAVADIASLEAGVEAVT